MPFSETDSALQLRKLTTDLGVPKLKGGLKITDLTFVQIT